MKVAASPQIYMGDTRIPFSPYRHTVSDRDFSTSLEMTIRESLLSPSLLVSQSPSLLIPNP